MKPGTVLASVESMPYRILKPPPDWLDLQQVEQEADRLIAGRNLLLRFPPALEWLFQDERSSRRRGQLVHTGLIALLVFDLFLVGDYLLSPQSLVRAVVVRFGIVTPVTLLSLWMLWRFPVKTRIPEWMAFLYPTLACAATLYLHHFSYASAATQADPGVLLLLVVMNTLLRPDLWAALLGTISCCSMFAVFLVSCHMVPVAQRMSMGGHVFWCAVLTLVANAALSREQRFSWLLQMRARIQRQMLAEANEELLSQSLQDQLTGIPNRAAYEKRLPELWQQAVTGSEPIAAVMVDVDYFKQVNDTFGHLFGDRVLQRIASLLEQAMRAEMDFVARYGGEEFVVLLPGSTLEAGVQVAERIRKLVEVAGSPALSRGDAPLPTDAKWSTVSCGVASITPTDKDEAHTLIHAADAALYVAKQSGRNRVCTTGTLTLVHSA